MENKTGKYWTLVAVVNKKKSGEGTYIKVLKDIPKGVFLTVLDPRDRLTEEQLATLESEGKVEISTGAGRTKTIYSNTVKELFIAPSNS